jgi:hypothetical protein
MSDIDWFLSARAKVSISYDEAIDRLAYDETPARKTALRIKWCYEVPWSPPEQLTKTALLEYGNEPRIWLMAAVNLMAFGRSAAPKDLDEIEIVVRRVQAAIALFEGPARKGIVSLIGSPDLEGGDRSETIPAAYFDMPRCLGNADNSISTNMARVSDACEGPSAIWNAARQGQHQKWFNVRLEGPSFISWLSSLLQHSDSSHPISVAKSTTQSGKPGRRETYDWPSIIDPLKEHVEKLNKEGHSFESLIDLAYWCRENVKLRQNARRPKRAADGPDIKTVKAAILRYHLDKIAGLRVEE